MTVGRRYRILMFAPAFAPFANAEALVNSKLALAMLDAGWEIEVISRRLAGASPYDYGSGWNDPWTALRGITHEIDDGYDGRVKRMAEIMEGAIVTGAVIHGCRWAGKAFKLAYKLHRQKPFDVILSRAFPESAHAAALALSSKTGIPWVANWNDPWEFLREGIRAGSLAENIGRLSAMFCKRVSRRANWHTFPAQKLRETMASYLGDGAEGRSSVIPHVALRQNHKTGSSMRDYFTICYMGRISKPHNPEVLFCALVRFLKEHPEASSIRFRFVGLDDFGLQNLAEKHGLQRNCSTEARLPYLEALRIASTSDVLIVIDPPELHGMILTSKFVDYVQTGRPILALTSIGGTLSEILGRYGGGIAVDNSSEIDICNAISEFYSRWCDSELNDAYGSANLYSHFSPERIVALYKDLFIHLSESKR